MSIKKCPICSGTLDFKSKSKKWKCQYCQTKFTEKQLEDKKKTLIKYKATLQEDDIDYEPKKMNVHRCDNCGAEIITDQMTYETDCCYCGSQLTFSEYIEDEFRPKKIIPFSKSKLEIQDVFVNHAKKFKYIPKDLTSKETLEQIRPVYIPCWIANAECNGVLRAAATIKERKQVGNYIHEDTSYYNVMREGNLHYDNIIYNGSTKINANIMNYILPYDYSELVDFSYSHLSGYVTEKYNQPKEQVYKVLLLEIENAAINTLKSSIQGYNGDIKCGIQHANVKKVGFAYALLPVWVMSYSYKNKKYFYVINDQTGKIYGNMPLVKVRLSLTIAAISLLTTAIIYGILRLISVTLFNPFCICMIILLLAFFALMVIGTRIENQQLKEGHK